MSYEIIDPETPDEFVDRAVAAFASGSPLRVTGRQILDELSIRRRAEPAVRHFDFWITLIDHYRTGGELAGGADISIVVYDQGITARIDAETPLTVSFLED